MDNLKRFLRSPGRIFPTLLSLLWPFWSCLSPDTYRPIAGSNAELVELLEKVRREYNQPAMGAAIIHNDRIVAEGVTGVTVLNETRPVTPDSRFHIGSTTKGMTALLIAIMVKKGELKYDSTLSDVLTDIPMRSEYARVTVRDLLLNRSGLLAFQNPIFEDPVHMEKLRTEIPARYRDARSQRRAMAEYVLNLPPQYAPGSRSVYSNVGWSILGLVAETVVGESYEDLMHDEVFTPLGMQSARIGGWPADDGDRSQPRGHYAQTEGPRAQPLDDEYRLPLWMNPAGGVHCSIHEYALYARENLLGLRGQGRLLAAGEYREIHSIQNKVKASEMYLGQDNDSVINLGYGWAVLPGGDGLLSVADGSGGTFYARVIVFPWLRTAYV
ncbi:MAG: beta-lactamase family protein, partial [Leptospiraceae bacterium]|nr:beta-lactamase family protein [Leptospiraceae bacterium]